MGRRMRGFAVKLYPLLPHADYIAGGFYIRGRVAPNEQEVGPESGCDAAAVSKPELLSRNGGRGGQRLGGSQSGPHEEFHFLMNAGAVARSRIWRIGSGEYWNSGRFELANGLFSRGIVLLSALPRGEHLL